MAGNVKGMGYGNGVTNLYQYDSQNRLTNLVWQAGGAGLASFGYKLMPGGTRTNALETVNAGPAVTCQWSFDTLYRLTNEIVSGIGNAGYQYDGVGNRLGRVGSLGPVNQSASYDTNDVWTAGSYGNPSADGDFNTTSYNGNSYGYDSFNRLTVLNGVSQSYAYDGDGNLLVKHLGGTNTFYLVDDRNPSGYAQVLEEYTQTNGWGSAGWDLSRVYVYGLGLVSEQEMDLNTLMPSTLSYYGYDGHGNVRFLMDTNGAITDTYRYDAFGNLIGSSGTTPNSYLYCGQRWDADLGLYYNRARYMNPDAGRFMTMDTYEGDQEDPLSLHKYLYAADDPVDNDDPGGHDYGDFDINLSSIYGLLFKDLLDQYTSETPDLLSGRNPGKPETFTIDHDPHPPGSKTFTALDGETFLAPADADFQVVYKAGQSILFKYDFFAINENIGHYGKFDFQRNKGQGEKLNNTFYTAYEDASNYGVGVYMKGANYSLADTIYWGHKFAHTKKTANANDPRPPKWWTLGWNAANAGSPNGLSH